MPREEFKFEKEEEIKEVVKQPLSLKKKFTVQSIVKSSLLLKDEKGNQQWVSILEHPNAKVGDVINI